MVRQPFRSGEFSPWPLVTLLGAYIIIIGFARPLIPLPSLISYPNTILILILLRHLHVLFLPLWRPYIAEAGWYSSLRINLSSCWRGLIFTISWSLLYLLKSIYFLFALYLIFTILTHISTLHLLAQELPCPEYAHIVVPWGVKFSTDQQSSINNEYLNILFFTNAEVPPDVWVRTLTESTKITQYLRTNLTLVMHLGNLVPHNSGKVLKRFYGALGHLYSENSGPASQRVESHGSPLTFRNWHDTRLEKGPVIHWDDEVYSSLWSAEIGLPFLLGPSDDLVPKNQ